MFLSWINIFYDSVFKLILYRQELCIPIPEILGIEVFNILYKPGNIGNLNFPIQSSSWRYWKTDFLYLIISWKYWKTDALNFLISWKYIMDIGCSLFSHILQIFLIISKAVPLDLRQGERSVAPILVFWMCRGEVVTDSAQSAWTPMSRIARSKLCKISQHSTVLLSL